MPKVIDDLTKHTLHLFAGDYAALQAAYPDTGAAHVIRTIIKAHVKKLNPPIDPTKIKGDPDV
jgi:hypothetical protein